MSINSPISDQEIQRGIVAYFNAIGIRNLTKLYIETMTNDIRKKMEEVTFTHQDTREDKNDEPRGKPARYRRSY